MTASNRPALSTLAIAVLGFGTLVAQPARADAGAAVAPAHAAGLPADLQRLLDATTARGTLRHLPARTRAEGPQEDTPPPQLTAFNLPARMDVASAGVDAPMTFSATDSQSGVTQGSAWLVGPHGQMMSVYFGDGVPRPAAKSGHGRVIGTAWAEPGTWTLNQVNVYDYVGNGAHYDAAALDALGIVRTMEVSNRRGGDIDAPTLVHGTVRTPTLSLSATQKGTGGAPAVFRVDLQAQDAGPAQVSGVRYAYASWCTDDQLHCFTTYPSDNLASGLVSPVLALSAVPADAHMVPGFYHLRDVTMLDFANNLRKLTNVIYGGETDFSQAFDVTTVSLTL